MSHLLEVAREVGTHALRGRIGVEEQRILRLQKDEFVHQMVELLVGNCGRILDVIIIVVVVQQFAQLKYSLFLHGDCF